MPQLSWPTARDFSEAIQNPTICFRDSELRRLSPVVDRLGMPLIASGNYACVCKMSTGADSFALRFFTRMLGDRQRRYQLISDYLNTHNIVYFPEFEYKPEEILIQGKRFPILYMDWVEGTRLDLCVKSLLTQPKALRFIADEWIDLTVALERERISHGDLQHGNVIVEGNGGKLRLVDLDSMYVPQMAGLPSCEDGHSAYQHPQRANAQFNETLDRFSTHVIYLSLIALAERPKLWDQYHDENLIFKKSDFANPSASPLFRDLGRMNNDISRIARVLTEACMQPPGQVPSLLTLVQPSVKTLPSWMRGEPDLRIEIKTREATSQPNPASLSRETVESDTGGAPWWKSSAGSTAQHPTAVTTPHQGQPGSFSSAYNWSQIQNFLSDALAYCFTFGIMGVVTAFLWWGIASAILQSLEIIPRGARGADAAVPVWICFAIIVVALSIWKAWKDRFHTSTRTPSTHLPIPKTYTPQRPTQQAPQPTPSATGVVASRIRSKYHRPNCRWARRIDHRNRITFASSTDARRAGLRPCGECHP